MGRRGNYFPDNGIDSFRVESVILVAGSFTTFWERDISILTVVIIPVLIGSPPKKNHNWLPPKAITYSARSVTQMFGSL